LIAPDELAGQPARVVRIQLSSGGKFPKWILLLLVIPLFVLIVIGLAGVGILAPLFYSVSRPAREATTPARPNVPAKEKTNSFATVLLDLGSEGNRDLAAGTGPGVWSGRPDLTHQPSVGTAQEGYLGRRMELIT